MVKSIESNKVIMIEFGERIYEPPKDETLTFPNPVVAEAVFKVPLITRRLGLVAVNGQEAA